MNQPASELARYLILGTSASNFFVAGGGGRGECGRDSARQTLGRLAAPNPPAFLGSFDPQTPALKFMELSPVGHDALWP